MSDELPREVELPDAEATEALGGAIAGHLQAGDLVLLEGRLGAGKTTLVRGLVVALGGNPGEVCSPTFTLLETYSSTERGIARVHHADLYRLRGLATAPWDEVGLGDALADAEAVTAVEWPESWEWLASECGRVLRVFLRFSGDARKATLTWT